MTPRMGGPVTAYATPVGCLFAGPQATMGSMRGRTTLFLVLTGTLLHLALSAPPGRAAIYSFVDERGVIHLTNVPTDHRYRPLFREKRRAGVRHHIQMASRRYRLDPLLIEAVIAVESAFDRWAVSRKGAQGLMQLMPETARDLAVGDPFDPAANIDGGARYLRRLLDLFAGDLELALAAYNAGPNRVQAVGRVPPIPETKRYVRAVLSTYRRLQGRR